MHFGKRVALSASAVPPFCHPEEAKMKKSSSLVRRRRRLKLRCGATSSPRSGGFPTAEAVVEVLVAGRCLSGEQKAVVVVLVAGRYLWASPTQPTRRSRQSSWL